MGTKNVFTASVEIFRREKGWHFVKVPAEYSKKYDSLADRGLIAVTVYAGKSCWQTSLLPYGDLTHFIALPLAVKKKEKIALGDKIKIIFELRNRKNL